MSTTKFSLKDILGVCWILLNVFILLATVSGYLLAWHFFSLSSTSHEDILVYAHLFSKEQLSLLYTDQDSAIRGLENEIYLLLDYWIGTALLNTLIVTSYFYLIKRKRSPADTSSP